MSPQQKRQAVLDAYPGGNWANRVTKMTDAQVHTVYMRLLNSNKLKK